ncbi:hypothetical protein DY000_02017131 [Brassica cretica]|uniref:Uncharacterized protein n=1 Tax=Brassica cretica TaxID=69181 RepID=A0ABQ7DE07_BRACR|nr:hypothetical protein DY000_02017131 [Brassica cretica]
MHLESRPRLEPAFAIGLHFHFSVSGWDSIVELHSLRCRLASVCRASHSPSSHGNKSSVEIVVCKEDGIQSASSSGPSTAFVRFARLGLED